MANKFNDEYNVFVEQKWHKRKTFSEDEIKLIKSAKNYLDNLVEKIDNGDYSISNCTYSYEITFHLIDIEEHPYWKKTN